MIVRKQTVSGQAQRAPKTVNERLGRLLGTPIGSEADTVRMVQRGISIQIYDTVARELKLAPDAIAPPSTLRRRKRLVFAQAKAKSGRSKVDQAIKHTTTLKVTARGHEESRLSQTESERLIRLARVYAEAEQLFDDEKAALTWLNTPADFLQDDHPITPMKLAETEAGARLVESLIKRTAYGSF